MNYFVVIPMILICQKLTHCRSQSFQDFIGAKGTCTWFAFKHLQPTYIAEFVHNCFEEYKIFGAIKLESRNINFHSNFTMLYFSSYFAFNSSKNASYFRSRLYPVINSV